MTNIIIFGRNPFLVDIIGHWLGGHEPGNFGLFHIAKERGLCKTINPIRIPVYLWENGIPELMPLEMFERYDLKTRYLQRNYGGQNEPLYHLVNEHHDYSPETSVRSFDNKKEKEIQKPNVEIIGQNFPNPFNGKTNIEYVVPNSGYVSLEIYNSIGEKVDVLVSGWQNKGTHVVSWNAQNKTSGIYFYLFKMDGFQKIGKMVLAR